MSKEFKTYEKKVTDLIDLPSSSPKSLERILNWYQIEGSRLYRTAFERETGLRVPRTQKSHISIGHAVSKTSNDLERKLNSNPYYRTHAYWFLEEIKYICECVPKNTKLSSSHANQSVFNFVKKLMLDSRVLVSDYGQYRLGVPLAYGIGKNYGTHNVQLYQSVKQIIYGHGSYGLSFMDNHSEVSISLIRQSIELKMFRVFGVKAKLRVNDRSLLPIALSSLFDAVNPHKLNINFPVPLEMIIRVNGWANLYLHSGQKEYAWLAPRVLTAMRPFLLAQRSRGDIYTNLTTFNSIRTDFKNKHEFNESGNKNGNEIILLDQANCDLKIVP